MFPRLSIMSCCWGLLVGHLPLESSTSVACCRSCSASDQIEHGLAHVGVCLLRPLQKLGTQGHGETAGSGCHAWMAAHSSRCLQAPATAGNIYAVVQPSIAVSKCRAPICCRCAASGEPRTSMRSCLSARRLAMRISRGPTKSWHSSCTPTKTRPLGLMRHSKVSPVLLVSRGSGCIARLSLMCHQAALGEISDLRGRHPAKRVLGHVS